MKSWALVLALSWFLIACGSDDKDEGLIQAAIDEAGETTLDTDFCKVRMKDHQYEPFETIEDEEFCF